MSDAVLALLLAIGLPALSAAAMYLYLRADGGSQQYAAVTPGLIPTDVDTAQITRAGGTPIPVQFNPPPASAGLVGTLLTQRARPREVSATVVDLAGRGYLTMRQVPAADGVPADWWFTRTEPALPTPLADYEQTILDGLFEQGSPVAMSALRASFGRVSAQAMGELERETLHRGWFSRPPQEAQAGVRGLSTVLIVLSFVALFLTGNQHFGAAGIGAAVGLLGSGAVIAYGARRVGARTAQGTAIAVQALGFRRYLETAEASQIRFEEAAGIFSKYLPYAIVFNLADHWAKVFGDVARAAQAEGFDVETPAWFVADDLSLLTFSMLAFSMDDFMGDAMFGDDGGGDFGSGDGGWGDGDGGSGGDGGFGDGGSGDGGGGWFGGDGGSGDGGGWFGGDGGFGDFGGFGD